jgi:hypothetical protein
MVRAARFHYCFFFFFLGIFCCYPWRFGRRSAWVHGDRVRGEEERSLAGVILLILNSGDYREVAAFVVEQIRSVFSSILFSVSRSV